MEKFWFATGQNVMVTKGNFGAYIIHNSTKSILQQYTTTTYSLNAPYATANLSDARRSEKTSPGGFIAISTGSVSILDSIIAVAYTLHRTSDSDRAPSETRSTARARTSKAYIDSSSNRRWRVSIIQGCSET